MNNLSLGSRTSMVHKYHPIIHLIPIGDEPRVMIPHTTLFLPPEHKHCILANITYSHAQK